MNDLARFNFDTAEVRVVTDDKGEPWFVGKDVCDVLGYVNHNDAMGIHCKGVAKRYPIPDVIGRMQEMRLLSEPDVMRLIIKSSLPASEKFERWVFEEVLPSIRKTGSYSVAKLSQAEMLYQAAGLLVEHDNRIKRLEAKQSAFEDGISFFTVIGYVKYKKLSPVSSAEAVSLGKKAAALSRKKGVQIDKVKDGRFGEVGSYHESILDVVFSGRE